MERTARRTVSIVAAALGAAAATLALPATAEAFTNNYDHPRFFVINGRVGFNAPFYGCGGGGCGLAGYGFQLSAGVDIGFRLWKEKWKVKGQGDAFYLGLTPQFGLFNLFSLWVPLTVEYDIPLPPKGLYVYPRSEIGPGFLWDFGYAHMSWSNGAGVKYHIHQHLQLGGDISVVNNWAFFNNNSFQYDYARLVAFVGGQFGN
jgi:hypothetical protein